LSRSPQVNSGPPRLWRALVRRALPADRRDDIIGDLSETFARDAASTGSGAALRRYRRRALTLAGRFLLERGRERLAAIARVRFSPLDLRLGVRMLWRYPVLSCVSTVSLALAVAIGALAWAVITMFLWPSLPMPAGDRVVRIQLHDDISNQFEAHLTADFLRWRGGTITLSDVGAWARIDRNMTMADGAIEPVTIAEVTPSMFALAGSTPVIGRALNDADARLAAPAVMVIGQRLWRDRFAADPSIVGRAVLLSDTPTTVVGVLPEPFRFPVQFEVWQPLKLDESSVRPRQGRSLDVWARLKPDAAIETAAREMTQTVRQEAIDWPATHAHLSASVQPFARSFSTMGPEDRLAIGSLHVVIGFLIAVVSGNVALLMFTRAATRETEIAVRSALGAGRARIIAQFFAESLALSGLALGAGWILARWGLRYAFDAFVATSNSGRVPAFWYQPTLPPVSVAYAVAVALFAALVTGVMPALKVTRRLATRIRESAPGAGGLKVGGAWTVLIIAQVALTLAMPVVMYFVRSGQRQIEAVDIGVPTSEYLVASLSPGARTSRARFVQDVRAIREALPSISGVSHATVADRLPFFAHENDVLQVDDGGAAAPDDQGGYRAAVAAVDPDFFGHFEMTPIAGRLFSAGDYVGRPRAAVVNQLFVDRVFGGRNPIGRRVKFMATSQEPAPRPPSLTTDTRDPWLDIVGVVRDLCMGYPGSAWKQGLYVPLDLRHVDTVWVTARVPGALPGGLTTQALALRVTAAKIDPSLLVTAVQTLPEVVDLSVRETGTWVKVLGVVSGWVMLLGLSGIYAVLSFAVSRRTREIGIRLALGSNRPRVVLAILRGPLIQIAAGVVVGVLIGTAFGRMVSGGAVSVLNLAFCIAVIAGVCVLACLVPVRRALAVDPIAALRVE